MTDLCKPEFFHGYLNWTEQGIRRLTPPVQDWFVQHERWNIRACCPAGVSLQADTDATEVGFTFVIGDQSRPVGAFGVVIDGECRNPIEFPLEPAEQTVRIPLDGQPHQVIVYLPHLICITLKKVWAEGDAAPVAPLPKRYYAFGDSITQGMTGIDPAVTYPCQIARAKGMELINFGVGGIHFIPETLQGLDAFPKPDLVTVALGTNDWSEGQTKNMSTFLKSCAAYLKEIDRLYHDAYVLLPTWRRGEEQSYKRGTLQNIRENIARVAAYYPGMTVIDCQTMIPADEQYFVDGLHPNDQGFALLGQGLLNALEK